MESRIKSLIANADRCRAEGLHEQAELWERLALEIEPESISDRIVFVISITVIAVSIGNPMAGMVVDVLALFGDIAARWLS